MNNTDLLKLTNELSLHYFHKPFHDKVAFNNRLRTTGGRYIPSKRTIEINPKFLREIGEEEMIGIIKHELCHYHLHIEGRGYHHRDQDFKELLRKTNSPRHCNPLPSVKKAKINHVYKCANCDMTYNRIRRINTARYRCGKCRGKLLNIT
jgi:SprT-like protein